MKMGMTSPVLAASIVVCSLVGVLAAWVSHGASAAVAHADAHRALVQALRQHIRHVFVIYQENHSFDEYFGTYPGADNLASVQASSHGFRQYDPIGKQWVTPFFDNRSRHRQSRALARGAHRKNARRRERSICNEAGER